MLLHMLLSAETDLQYGLLPPPQTNGQAGAGVAASGDDTTIPLTVAIGAPGYRGGAVFIYQWNGVAYQWLQTIIGPSLNTGFGEAIALSDDGSELAVGAPDELGEGRVHVYEWSGALYVPQQILDRGTGPVPGPGARFGQSVAFDTPGTAILIGAPLGGTLDQGHLYTWYRALPHTPPAKQWTFVQGFQANAIFQNSAVGRSVVLSADGLIAVASGTRFIYIWERASISVSFNEVFTRFSSSDAFGVGVTLDGSLAFVATQNGVDSFENQGAQTWNLVGHADVPAGRDLGPGDWGSQLAVRNLELIVGGDDDSISQFTFSPDGTVITFDSNKSSPNGVETDSAFGHSVALVYPGIARVLVVGEPGRDRQGLSDAGNAYTFVT